MANRIKQYAGDEPAASSELQTWVYEHPCTNDAWDCRVEDLQTAVRSFLQHWRAQVVSEEGQLHQLLGTKPWVFFEGLVMPPREEVTALCPGGCNSDQTQLDVIALGAVLGPDGQPLGNDRSRATCRRCGWQGPVKEARDKASKPNFVSAKLYLEGQDPTQGVALTPKNWETKYAAGLQSWLQNHHQGPYGPGGELGGGS